MATFEQKRPAFTAASATGFDRCPSGELVFTSVFSHVLFHRCHSSLSPALVTVCNSMVASDNGIMSISLETASLLSFLPFDTTSDYKVTSDSTPVLPEQLRNRRVPLLSFYFPLFSFFSIFEHLACSTIKMLVARATFSFFHN